MSEFVVVYELGEPVTAHDSGEPAGAGELPVRRVHAAPAAPGMTAVPGPRTFCGRDTFAMQRASWQPPGQPGSAWCDPQYASRVCPACDDAAGDG
ncbi:hypothetical protein ACFVFI_25270 [Streptomyces sp. NPDC057705]|uniref:hypothetical protein n=1 Tax=Streptomyces sp. NPDC057705 TaxID=3346222 RepID=UPI0036CD411D